jgi:hypothetical protein
MLTSVYLELDGSPIETSIMLGYHGTVLRTSYARCKMLYGLNLPYPGEWDGEWADKTNSQHRRIHTTGLPALLRLQNAETTQLDGMLRPLALSSRLLVVSLSPTNDRIIPLEYRRACSILEHQTDDRKFIKHYDYHSEVVLRYEENPRILNWGPSQPHPLQAWGPRLSSQGKGRVPQECC